MCVSSSPATLLPHHSEENRCN